MKKLFILVAAVCCFVACGGSNTPIDVVKTVNEAAIAKDFKTIADHIYLEDEADREKAPQMIEFLYSLGESMGGRVVVSAANYTEEATDDPNKVIVRFESTDANGKVEKEKTTCIRNADGVWQVELMD